MKRSKIINKSSDKREERGAALIEYALLAALIAIIAIVGVRLLGQGVSSAFSTVNSGLAGANN